MNRYVKIFIILLIVFTGSTSSIGAAEEKDIGNVVLIGWDGAQRAHLKELLSQNQLPNLQALIEEGGMVNTEVSTGRTQTKPGWVEILTGYSSVQLGIPQNREYQPIPKGYTVFERLENHFGENNIATIFIGGKINNIGGRGPHEICINCISRDPATHQKTKYWDKKLITTSQTWDGKPPLWVAREGEPYYNSKKVTDFHLTALGPAKNVGKEALAALEKYHQKPFFAFFHFEEPDEQGHLYGENSAEYDQALKTADSWLGKIVEKLKALGVYQKTTVFVTSDHGMDEGGFEHNDAPFMFLATNSKKKLHDGDRKDIAPTILETYGIDPSAISPRLEGSSLFVKTGQSSHGRYNDYNLLMISLGNVGAKNMSLYGYKRRTTPLLDEWARNAVVFESVFVPASWTLPVATSLFTSLQPYSHKVLHRYTDNILDKRIKTLPEILKDAGYKTASFTGGLDYAHSFGHMRGFDEYDKNPNFTGFKVTLKQADTWLKDNGDKKFFLFLHSYDAHCPFDPPKEFEGTFSTREGKKITVDNTLCLRGYEDKGKYIGYYYKVRNPNKVILNKDDIEYLEALYDEEVLYEDYLVGNFLKNLDKKLMEKTIIVIVAEHGEMFAKHGRFGRAGTARGTLYDEVVHIPLVMKFPEKSAKRVTGLLQVIDIMPTLLGLLGIDAPDFVQGKDWGTLITEGGPANQYVFAGSEYGPGYYYKFKTTNESIRDKSWKLIHEKRKKEGLLESGYIETYELYDLRSDSDEFNNVAAEHPDIVITLKKELKKYMEEKKKFDIKNTSSGEIDSGMFENLLEKIKEHGYW